MAKDVMVDGAWMKLEICFTCKTPFVMSSEIHAVAKQLYENFSFYCPHGHRQHYCTGESEKQKLERQLSIARQQIARAEDEAREARSETTRVARQKKLLEKRIHAGICPCCSRHFVNLERHMKTKHADGKVIPLKSVS